MAVKWWKPVESARTSKHDSGAKFAYPPRLGPSNWGTWWSKGVWQVVTTKRDEPLAWSGLCPTLLIVWPLWTSAWNRRYFRNKVAFLTYQFFLLPWEESQIAVVLVYASIYSRGPRHSFLAAFIRSYEFYLQHNARELLVPIFVFWPTESGLEYSIARRNLRCASEKFFPRKLDLTQLRAMLSLTNRQWFDLRLKSQSFKKALSPHSQNLVIRLLPIIYP